MEETGSPHNILDSKLKHMKGRPRPLYCAPFVIKRGLQNIEYRAASLWTKKRSCKDFCSLRIAVKNFSDLCLYGS
jgi:hypothetical protein